VRLEAEERERKEAAQAAAEKSTHAAVSPAGGRKQPSAPVKSGTSTSAPAAAPAPAPTHAPAAPAPAPTSGRRIRTDL
jgi:hypothetical protein